MALGERGRRRCNGKGFRLAQRKPRECDGGDGEEGGEYRAPAAQPQDPLSKGRGDGGNEDEHGHDERHETSHSASFVLIAHQGHGHDTRSRDSDALQDAARDHHLEGACEDAHETSGHEQDEARMDSGPAPDTVGERAENDLAQAEPQEQSRDDELDVVRTRRPEVVTDGGQRRQHRVGRKRDERYQQGDKSKEFAGTKGGSAGLWVHSSSQQLPFGTGSVGLDRMILAP